MPIIEGIEGRWEDMCLTKDGRQVLRFDTVFKGVEGIREAQVVQLRLDAFVVRVVPDSGYSDRDSTTLVANMRKHVGSVDIRIELVPAIERTQSGKFRAVICQLDTEEKRGLMGKL